MEGRKFSFRMTKMVIIKSVESEKKHSQSKKLRLMINKTTESVESEKKHWEYKIENHTEKEAPNGPTLASTNLMASLASAALLALLALATLTVSFASATSTQKEIQILAPQNQKITTDLWLSRQFLIQKRCTVNNYTRFRKGTFEKGKKLKHVIKKRSTLIVISSL